MNDPVKPCIGAEAGEIVAPDREKQNAKPHAPHVGQSDGEDVGHGCDSPSGPSADPESGA